MWHAAKMWTSSGGASIDQQLLDADLADELRIDLVPVLLGNGIRLFDQLRQSPVDLEQVNRHVVSAGDSPPVPSHAANIGRNRQEKTPDWVPGRRPPASRITRRWPMHSANSGWCHCLQCRQEPDVDGLVLGLGGDSLRCH